MWILITRPRRVRVKDSPTDALSRRPISFLLSAGIFQNTPQASPAYLLYALALSAAILRVGAIHGEI